VRTTQVEAGALTWQEPIKVVKPLVRGGPGTEKDFFGEEHAPHRHRRGRHRARPKVPLLVPAGHRVPGGPGEVRRRRRTFLGQSDAYATSMRQSARVSAGIWACKLVHGVAEADVHARVGGADRALRRLGSQRRPPHPARTAGCTPSPTLPRRRARTDPPAPRDTLDGLGPKVG
jgi:hypothetical protein